MGRFFFPSKWFHFQSKCSSFWSQHQHLIKLHEAREILRQNIFGLYNIMVKYLKTISLFFHIIYNKTTKNTLFIKKYKNHKIHKLLTTALAIHHNIYNPKKCVIVNHCRNNNNNRNKSYTT